MELIQAKGNTWYLKDWQLIPLYRVDEEHCILLDTGFYEQREQIEQVLKQVGMIPVGVIGTHVHTDHTGGLFYFQQKYHIPVALPEGEAGLCANHLDLKVNFFVFPLRECCEAEDVAYMTGRPDEVIRAEEAFFEMCGVRFELIRLPGHSPDHIGIKTPDDVLYVGDAIMAGDDLHLAKLPYYLSIETALQSMKRLKRQSASLYLAAHRGVYSDIGDVIEENRMMLEKRCDEIASLITEPMTMSEIQEKVCMEYKLLSSNIRKAELYERGIRSFVEYLRDEEKISVCAKNGVLYYG